MANMYNEEIHLIEYYPMGWFTVISMNIPNVEQTRAYENLKYACAKRRITEKDLLNGKIVNCNNCWIALIVCTDIPDVIKEFKNRLSNHYNHFKEE